MAEYIEREAAVAAAFSATSLGNSAFRDVYDTVNRLRLIPTADVAPVRHGRWIWGDDGYHCSECCYNAADETAEILAGCWEWCPVCGAKMDGGTEYGQSNSQV